MAEKSGAITRIADMTRHVERETLKNVYLFYGEEEYLKDFYIGKLCHRLLGGTETEGPVRFDGKGKAAEIQAACESLPMFGETACTVVLVRDSGAFKGAGKGPENDFGFLDELPEDSYVIFRETEIDKKTKNYQVAAKCGIVFECCRQKENIIAQVLAKQAAQNGRKISAQAVSLMVTGIGFDLTRLMNEVEKLCMLVGEGGTIEASHVREVCELSLSARIYDLTDGIVGNNREKALTMLHVLLEDKMPPAMIMAAVGQHFLQLYNVKCMDEKGMSRQEIFGVCEAEMAIRSEFVVTKLLKQAKNYTPAALADRIRMITEMDMRIKSGVMDPVNALELVIASA